MPCTPFKRLESGKVVILENELNTLKLKEDVHYLVDDSLLNMIKNNPEQKQYNKESQAYVVVGWSKDKSVGIASEIGPERLEKTLEEIKRYDNIIVNSKMEV